MEGAEGMTATECFNIAENTFGPLNILKHSTNNINFLVLWNEYSILVKNLAALKSVETFHYTNFYIKQILLHENIFLCLDNDQILHFTILMKKNERKILKTLELKQMLKNVLFLLSNEANIYVALNKDGFLCIYEYNLVSSTKIKVARSYRINLGQYTNIVSGDVSMEIKQLKYFSIDFIQNIFHVELSRINLEALIVFLKSENVLYWSILNQDPNKINELKVLYASPAKIKSFHILKEIDVKFSLSLETGSVMILCYNVSEKCLIMNIINLNSSFENIVYLDDSTILYSDCDKVYVSLIQSKMEEYHFVLMDTLQISFPYFFIYDSESCCVFVTTIHNIIYKVKIEKNNIKKDNMETISIPKDFTPIKDVMSEIQEEINHSNDLISRTNIENDYLTILFLNSKQKLIVNHFNTQFTFYKFNDGVGCFDDSVCYGNIENENKTHVITVSVDTTLRAKLETMMKNINNLLFLEINLSSDNCVFQTSVLLEKTPSIKVGIPSLEKLKPPFSLNVNIIVLMPRVFQPNHKFWSIISTKEIMIDSSYFFSNNNERKRRNEKQIKYEFENKILTISKRNTRFLLDISEKKGKDDTHFTLYIKLPTSLIFEKFSEQFIKHLSSCNGDGIKSELNDANFVNGHKTLTLCTLDETLRLTVQNINANDRRLRITCSSVEVCFEIYKFIIEILKSSGDSKKYVQHFDYIILKNLKENIEGILNNTQIIEKDDLLEFLEAFNKDALGMLPT